jgi:hypothetical protein
VAIEDVNEPENTKLEPDDLSPLETASPEPVDGEGGTILEIPAEQDAVAEAAEETVQPHWLNTHRKKIAIALLAFSNLAAMIILGTFEPPVEVTPADLATIDLAIEEKLKEYNIPLRQARKEQVRVDSTFSRVITRTGVPSGVSRTLLHLELHKELEKQGVRIPAVVKFPERDLNVHFMLGGTIVRTLVLRSDTSLKVLSYPGTVVFFTDSNPSSDALEELRSFGETHLIAARVESLSEAETFAKKMKGFPQSRQLIWVNGTENPGFKYDRFYVELTENLKKSLPYARMLMFNHANLSGNQKLWKTLQQQNWTVVMVPPASIEPSGRNEEEFLAMLDRFNKEALTAQNQLLLLPLRTDYVVWMKQHLHPLKKHGLRLVEAPTVKL